MARPAGSLRGMAVNDFNRRKGLANSLRIQEWLRENASTTTMKDAMDILKCGEHALRNAEQVCGHACLRQQRINTPLAFNKTATEWISKPWSPPVLDDVPWWPR